MIGKFKELYKAGKPLTVTSPGTQKRNFTYVGDTARALMMVGEKGHGDDYGIGSHESVSILELAQMFGGEIEMTPEKPGNRTESEIDTSKMEKEFGWKAEMKVKDYVASIKVEIK